jgi:hypothetical protein
VDFVFSDHPTHGRVTDPDMLGKFLERYELGVHLDRTPREGSKRNAHVRAERGLRKNLLGLST